MILLTIQLMVQAGYRGHLVSFDRRNEKLIRKRNICLCIVSFDQRNEKQIRRRNLCLCILFLFLFIFQLLCDWCNVQKFNFLLLNKLCFELFNERILGEQSLRFKNLHRSYTNHIFAIIVFSFSVQAVQLLNRSYRSV